MASIASGCRRSAQLAARRIRGHAAIRGFRASPTSLVAHNLPMPALSPTMTEGNIAKWMLKEGDSFSAGDVLLQVETDKAQMDVEAADDGVLAKIMQPDGSSAIKVGTRIAVLAESGDDLSTLESPAEDKAESKPSQQKPTDSSSESSVSSGSGKNGSTPQSNASSSTSSSNQATSSSDRPLYPSVQVLLHTRNISASDIKPSGPGGRILKGDVLAALGEIPVSYPSEVSQRLDKLSHLDLSNIKPAESTRPRPTKAVEESQPSEEEGVPLSEISLPVSLAAALKLQQRIHDSLGASPPLSELIARAITLANENLPARTGPASENELFDDILGVGQRHSRSRLSTGTFMPIIGPDLPAVRRSVRNSGKRDVLDEIISGRAATRRPSSSVTSASASAVGESGGAENVFSLVVDKVDEKRAAVFLSRMKSVLEVEPARLVL